MDNPFMNIQGDPENRDLLVHSFRALSTGKNEVTHLGRRWKTRLVRGKSTIATPSYLQTMVYVAQPDQRGRCKVRIELPHIVHEEGCHTLNGMAVPNQTGDASVFLFRNRAESEVRIEMAKKLIGAGKLNKSDLTGVLNEWELSNV